MIQRLFAIGLQLEGVVRQIAEPPVRDRVRRVDDLDGTIREVRSSIYGLRHAPEPSSLRVHLLEVVDAAEQLLGFPPSVRLSGLIDTVIPAGVADPVVWVLQETLANVVRHAHASSVSVEVEAFEDVLVRVVDDGIGLDGAEPRSGLRRLRERADLAQGRFVAVRGQRSGTELLWRAPLP